MAAAPANQQLKHFCGEFQPFKPSTSQALSGLERMQELVGKNLNNIVGNLWQRQETEGSGSSSHGNIVSISVSVTFRLLLTTLRT